MNAREIEVKAALNDSVEPELVGIEQGVHPHWWIGSNHAAVSIHLHDRSGAQIWTGRVLIFVSTAWRAVAPGVARRRGPAVPASTVARRSATSTMVSKVYHDGNISKKRRKESGAATL